MARGIGLLVAVVLLSSCAANRVEESVEVFPSCKPPPESCRQLLQDTFDEPTPGIAPASVGPLRLSSGEQSGEVFLWVYNGEFDGEERVVIAGVKKRTPHGYEPPDDPTALTLTPGGRSVVIRTGPDGAVAGLDFWNATYHYAVSLQGIFDPAEPVVGAAMSLIDALPEPG